MKFHLFEDQAYLDLLPLVFIRPIFDLQVGIFTCLERWKYALGKDSEVEGICFRPPYFPEGGLSLTGEKWINPRFLPEEELLRLIQSMDENTCYVSEKGDILCFSCKDYSQQRLPYTLIDVDACQAMGMHVVKTGLNAPSITRSTDLFSQIPTFLEWDFRFVQSSFPSQSIKDPHTIVYGKENIWVGEGAKMEAAILHAEDGPIYLGPGSTVQPGAVIMGGHSLGKGSTVGIGAKLRANSVIGAYAKVAGEVKNSLISSYSNKGHEGYMGNTVMGVGCNWGADTNVSNMKNTFSTVKQWSYRHRGLKDSSLNFCGTIMGDYSRTGINTMLNTGTVVGVSAHVFGEGFPPKFIPSFSWGSLQTYELPKAIEGAKRHLGLKGKELPKLEESALRRVFEETAVFRSWE